MTGMLAGNITDQLSPLLLLVDLLHQKPEVFAEVGQLRDQHWETSAEMMLVAFFAYWLNIALLCHYESEEQTDSKQSLKDSGRGRERPKT